MLFEGKERSLTYSLFFCENILPNPPIRRCPFLQLKVQIELNEVWKRDEVVESLTLTRDLLELVRVEYTSEEGNVNAGGYDDVIPGVLEAGDLFCR